MKTKLVVPAICFWIFSLSSAHALGFEAAVGGWQQDPGGKLSYEGLSDLDILDVDDNLRYDTENRPFGRAKIDMPLLIPNIYLIAAPSEFSGDGIANISFNFGGEVIEQDIPFYSKLTLNQYDIGLYYGLPFIKTATMEKLNIDLGLDIRIIDLTVQLDQSANNISVRESATLAVPMIFAGIQFQPIERLAIEAEGFGTLISDNTLYTIVGRLRVKVAGPVFAAGGYRYDSVDVDESDVVADFSLQGPFLEVGVKF